MGVLLTFLAAAAQDAEFTRELMMKKKATVGDVARVFHAFLDEKAVRTAKDAAAALAKHGRMPDDWDLDSNASLGEVCYLLCTTLGIEGGLTMRVIGTTPRYAYRECVYRGLVKPNGPHSAVSGRDLLSIAGRLEEELEKRAAGK
jgi:hypothetical protein